MPMPVPRGFADASLSGRKYSAVTGTGMGTMREEHAHGGTGIGGKAMINPQNQRTEKIIETLEQMNLFSGDEITLMEDFQIGRAHV